jgi:hypothetical protein
MLQKSTNCASATPGPGGGRSREDIHAEDPSGLDSWLNDVGVSPHGGESFREPMARVGDWIEKQREKNIQSQLLMHLSSVPPLCIPWARRRRPFGRIEVASMTLTDLRLNGSNWHSHAYGTSLRSPRGHS